MDSAHVLGEPDLIEGVKKVNVIGSTWTRNTKEIVISQCENSDNT